VKYVGNPVKLTQNRVGTKIAWYKDGVLVGYTERTEMPGPFVRWDAFNVDGNLISARRPRLKLAKNAMLLATGVALEAQE
jgi:hypothetical protein